MATYYRLDCYDENGALLTDFSSDPAHARPYLREPENLVGQEIDLAAGTAKIGGLNIEILDVPTNPADNDTGAVTAILPTISKGTRAQLLKSIDGAPYANVLRGVVDGIDLHGSYSSYTVRLKDEREVERRITAFTRCTTSSVVPRGVIDGFGALPGGGWLAPPVTPLTGTLSTFTDITVTHKRLTLPALPRDGKGRAIVTDANVDRILTDKQREQFVLDGSALFTMTVAPRVRLLWRLVGGGAFSAIEDLGGFLLRSIIGYTIGWYKDREVVVLQHLDFDWSGAPADGTQLEFIVGYAGPASEDYPFHFEGTAGELIAGIYDGDHSDNVGPAASYDAAAVAALTTPLRPRVTKPLDDENGVWKWVEENIYCPLSLAPALGADGTIAPVSSALPDISEVLLELDDTNCEPAPGWSTSTQSAINMVTVRYPRLYRVNATDDPLMDRSSGDGLAAAPGRADHWVIESIAQIGEYPLEMECETLAALVSIDGQPLTGDVHDEYGAQVARRKGYEATDRQAYGAQTFGPIRILESAWGSRNVGAFVLANCSWWPDFGTGERGANRLAQIVSVAPQNDGWVEVTAVDCGNEAAPVAAPTIGAATVVDDEAVEFLITPAVNTEARAEYAINPTLPANDSPLWRFLARVDTATTVRTPPVPPGSTVWRRGRGELVNRRPSAWINGAGGSSISVLPRITIARAFIDNDGNGTVHWENNALTAGVQIRFAIHSIGGTPSYGAAVDLDATDGEYDIPDVVPAGYQLTVELTPYTGWNGTNVTGTAGEAVTASAIVGADAVADIIDFAPVHSDPTGDTVDYVGYLIGSEARVYEIEAAQPVSADVWDTLEDPSNFTDALLPDSTGKITDTYDVPPEGFVRYVLVRPYRLIDGEYQSGDAIQIVVFDKKAQPPVIRTGHKEDGELGTALIQIQESGIPVVAVTVRTQVGSSEESAAVPPLRDAGDASVVLGGTLVAGEYEHDVTLDATRLTKLFADIELLNGKIITVGFGFDRNSVPDFWSDPWFDGTILRGITGDTDTNSIRVERLGGPWIYNIDARLASPIDVTANDPSGNAGQANNTVEIYRVWLFSDPIGDIDAGTLRVYRDLQLEIGASGEPVWSANNGTEPLIGSDVVTLELQASAAPGGYTAEVWARSRDKGGSWTAFTDITGDLSPALSAPPTALTSYTYATGFERIAKDITQPIREFEFRCDILNGSAVVVASVVIPKQWYRGPL